MGNEGNDPDCNDRQDSSSILTRIFRPIVLQSFGQDCSSKFQTPSVFERGAHDVLSTVVGVLYCHCIVNDCGVSSVSSNYKNIF